MHLRYLTYADSAVSSFTSDIFRYANSKAPPLLRTLLRAKEVTSNQPLIGLQPPICEPKSRRNKHFILKLNNTLSQKFGFPYSTESAKVQTNSTINSHNYYCIILVRLTGLSYEQHAVQHAHIKLTDTGYKLVRFFSHHTFGTQPTPGLTLVNQSISTAPCRTVCAILKRNSVVQILMHCGPKGVLYMIDTFSI